MTNSTDNQTPDQREPSNTILVVSLLVAHILLIIAAVLLLRSLVKRLPYPYENFAMYGIGLILIWWTRRQALNSATRPQRIALDAVFLFYLAVGVLLFLVFLCRLCDVLTEYDQPPLARLPSLGLPFKT